MAFAVVLLRAYYVAATMRTPVIHHVGTMAVHVLMYSVK